MEQKLHGNFSLVEIIYYHGQEAADHKKISDFHAVSTKLKPRVLFFDVITASNVKTESFWHQK